MHPVSVLKYVVISLILLWACRKGVAGDTLPFEKTPVLHALSAPALDEASGIADSYLNPGFLWVNEDSQQPTEVHLLEYNGAYRKKIFIKNVTNRDWEEIALGDGPIAGKKFLYIGEIGDNDRVFSEYIIYRTEEPGAGTDTVTQTEALRFKYPDGAHDAEAFFVDASKDIYIITKRDARSKVYKLAYPQSGTTLNTASFVMDLPYTGVTAASFLPEQNELLIKTYDRIYYYHQPGASVVTLLGSASKSLEYEPEPQGEAICFAANRSGFFTLSEKPAMSLVNLRFYKRK